MTRGGIGIVVAFHWAVNFHVEQLCIWQKPLRAIYPSLVDVVTHEIPLSWPGWPTGHIVACDAYKLRPSERGLKGIDLMFERGVLRIETDDLVGDEIVPSADSIVIYPLR